VTEVHWRIIANLSFKFRSHFTAHAAVLLAGAMLLAVLLAATVLLAGESSRAMLASARLSLYFIPNVPPRFSQRPGGVVDAPGWVPAP